MLQTPTTRTERSFKMRLKRPIPTHCAEAVVALLAPFAEGLDQRTLDEALRSYTPTPATPAQPWLTSREAAGLSRRSVYSIRRLVASGKLPASRINKRLLIRGDALEDLLREGTADEA